ncbi:hypothetical protein J3A83DRAFT_4189341 [Scleroderma citrinum]
MWRLIAEITKPANLKVLCGKLKHEVRPKQAYSNRLAQFYYLSSIASMLLLLEIHRIRGRYEGLAKVYKQYAKRLTITGEGIDPNSEDDTNLQTYRYSIEAGEPNESTAEQAKNIWDDIVSQFPFFPDLHCI